jgi:hypothetical protein
VGTTFSSEAWETIAWLAGRGRISAGRVPAPAERAAASAEEFRALILSRQLMFTPNATPRARVARPALVRPALWERVPNRDYR